MWNGPQLYDIEAQQMLPRYHPYGQNLVPARGFRPGVSLGNLARQVVRGGGALARGVGRYYTSPTGIVDAYFRARRWVRDRQTFRPKFKREKRPRTKEEKEQRKKQKLQPHGISGQCMGPIHIMTIY